MRLILEALFLLARLAGAALFAFVATVFFYLLVAEWRHGMGDGDGMSWHMLVITILLVLGSIAGITLLVWPEVQRLTRRSTRTRRARYLDRWASQVGNNHSQEK